MSSGQRGHGGPSRRINRVRICRLSKYTEMVGLVHCLRGKMASHADDVNIAKRGLNFTPRRPRPESGIGPDDRVVLNPPDSLAAGTVVRTAKDDQKPERAAP